ncbi:MAG: CYTH domain-containing protein [Magnetococcales bacterium]|nr:CYTH domain-containing protein [Magnetococcales bacterium]
MAVEIERKFLLKNNGWRGLGTGTVYRQGFLSTVKERVVRIRIAGERATLTIKGANNGISRQEYDYEIPMDDAEDMLNNLCEKPIIEKTRYVIKHDENTWEVDEFEGENKGLIIAEVELTDAAQTFTIPDWIGDDVSDDNRYYNSNLIKNPYCKWAE